MKQQATQYVALDVHQATLVVSVRDAQGAVVMRATIATEAKAVVGLIRGLGGRVHIAFEEGTQAQWLHDLLEPHALLELRQPAFLVDCRYTDVPGVLIPRARNNALIRSITRVPSSTRFT